MVTLCDPHSSSQPVLSYVLVLAGSNSEQRSPAGQENIEQIRCPLTFSLSRWSMERVPQQPFKVPSSSSKIPPYWTITPKGALSGQCNYTACMDIPVIKVFVMLQSFVFTWIHAGHVGVLVSLLQQFGIPIRLFNAEQPQLNRVLIEQHQHQCTLQQWTC